MTFDDMTVLSEKDKGRMAYAMCVLGTGAVGATFGSIAGGQTLPGFAGGLVLGLFMCKWVETPLKRKLFSSQRMSEQEFVAIARQTKKEFPTLTRDQVFDLLAEARRSALRDPGAFRC